MKSEEIKQLTDKALNDLMASLESGHSETLAAYLKAMGRFSKYSFRNLLLIAMQRPDARRVAGYQTWRKLGRYVRKGEKGIVIIAPMIRRKPAEEPDQTDKRWYNDDWKNLDKKLQSSVVEGISVFLSLFDDNPRVKRMFCPPPIQAFSSWQSAFLVFLRLLWSRWASTWNGIESYWKN